MLILLITILILGLFIISRYVSNTRQVTTQYYSRTDEILYPSTLSATTTIYIFWNGDLNSTYLLLDQLLQDKIIQPIYIERYTILKNLNHDKLNNIAKETKQEKDLLYLQYVARLKKQQSAEITQLSMLRKMILLQYPEFKYNFKPTQYVTNITKDIEFTNSFSNILYEIKPIHYDDIEFFEQVSRLTKHLNCSRILIGYSKDNKNIKLIMQIMQKLHLLDSKLELPLHEMHNKDIAYLATKNKINFQ